MASGYFSKATFDFLSDLKENNDRDWFAENKDRYEADVKAPALEVISEFGPLMAELSPHFRATPRSLYRLHRDVRFSRDKRPFKTHAGLHFRHQAAKDAYAPGFYVHVEPKNVFVGMGVWHPPSPALRAIREEIVEDPDGWRDASSGAGFTGTYELAGERLKRGPKGFDVEHPLIEDLKRKDFIGVAPRSQAFATSADLPSRLAELFADGVPFMRYLCKALDVPF